MSARLALAAKLALALAVAAAPGCSVSRTTTGVAVPAHATASIEPGHTTEFELIQRLGPPMYITRDLGRTFYVYEFGREDEGVLSLTYYATIFEYGQSEHLRERVVVQVGRDGVVRTIGIQREIDGEAVTAEEEAERAQAPGGLAEPRHEPDRDGGTERRRGEGSPAPPLPEGGESP